MTNESVIYMLFNDAASSTVVCGVECDVIVYQYV